MSATNRHLEGELVALDEDDPKAAAKLAADTLQIAADLGADPDVVRAVLEKIRAGKRKRKRAKFDFYETPTWAIDAISPHVPLLGTPIVLDAGAGTGAIAARVATINPKAEIVGVEKNPELVALARARAIYSVEFKEGDFLRGDGFTIAAPDVVFMNPPFSFAMQFIEKARAIVKRGGTVCALLRLNWLAGKCRREFLKKHLPDVHVLTKRPSFTGKGTDATEYAWFVWNPEATGKINLLTHDDKSRRRPRAQRKTPATPEA